MDDKDNIQAIIDDTDVLIDDLSTSFHSGFLEMLPNNQLEKIEALGTLAGQVLKDRYLTKEEIEC